MRSILRRRWSPAAPARRPTRILVLHIMKTAGTSLRHMLESELGPTDIYPSEQDLAELPHGWYPTTADMAERAPTLDQRVVIGHYPASLARVLAERDAPREVVTVLRDPVARTVSMLHHQQRLRDTTGPLESLLDDERFVEAQLRDYQTKVLGMSLGEVNLPYPTDDETLAAAVGAVRSMRCVGVAERFGRFCADFDAAYGTHLADHVRRDNVSPTGGADVPRALRARIVPLVERDLELYELAAAGAAESADG